MAEPVSQDGTAPADELVQPEPAHIVAVPGDKGTAGREADVEPASKRQRQVGLEAWYMDDSDADQRLEHRLQPNKPVSMDKLAALGVLHWKLDADKYETDSELKTIREDRGYTYQDIITVTPEKLPNYEAKIKTFYEEHLHTDEEIRYILDGSGYFDVRDADERWIRMDCRKGDMIVLPKGIYHRFTLDSNNYIKALRLFVGEPVWTPFNRPADELPARKEYLEDFLKAPVAVQ